MSGLGLDVRLKHGSVGEVRLDASRDTGQAVSSPGAVATAVRQVTIASHDQDRAGEAVRHGERSESQELTLGDGLLGLLAKVQDSGVEVRG